MLMYLIFQKKCQEYLVQSTGTFVKCVTPSVLKAFLDKTCLTLVAEKRSPLQLCALKGLESALQVPDPPESVVSMLYQTVAQVFNIFKNESNVSVCYSNYN